jgi:uncharacterized protein (DUF433 family)
MLKDYFDIDGPDEIRIKGTRVGIETVLIDYLNAMSPEEIATRYPVLSLEQVYATITHYLANQAEIDRYLTRWERDAELAWQEGMRNPSPIVQRLHGLKRTMHAQLASRV